MALKSETPAAETTRLLDVLLERQRRFGFVGENPIIQMMVTFQKYVQDNDARISALERTVAQMIVDSEDGEPV